MKSYQYGSLGNHEYYLKLLDNTKPEENNYEVLKVTKIVGGQTHACFDWGLWEAQMVRGRHPKIYTMLRLLVIHVYIIIHIILCYLVID